ncbi:MAG: hypothetical protein SGPRY_014813 [Prymnesium sp.]
MTSNAKSLGEAVTELFRPGVPAVQLPLSASVEDMQEIFQKKRLRASLEGWTQMSSDSIPG